MISPVKIQHLQAAISYDQYSELIEDLVAQNSTTGPNQSESMIGYTRLNSQRMKRVYKTTKILPELAQAVAKITIPSYWIVLTEAWCGDAAQSIPVLSKLADLGDNIELKLLLRDEHLDLMTKYLTDGARAIPKLVWMAKENFQEVATWGPRPAPAQELLKSYKGNPEETYDQFSEKLQRWYNQDKTETLQLELLSMIARAITLEKTLS
ncbi:MAG: thioredoxin family protein [Cyclobacteriaceae bacterium]